MITTRRRKAWLTLSEPEMSSLIHQLHFNEDGGASATLVGRRHLIGNFIVLEYADSLRACEEFVSLDELDKEVLRG